MNVSVVERINKNQCKYKDIKIIWDGLAEWYSDLEISNGEPSQVYIAKPELFRLCMDIPKGILLDAACGPGILSIELSRLGWRVIGVDISSNMIKRANAFSMCIDGIKFFTGDITKKCKFLFNDIFDVIVCNLALMDIQNYTSALDEFTRLLKLGGFLIFSVTHPEFEDPNVKQSLFFNNYDSFSTGGKNYIEYVRLKNWKTNEIAPTSWPHFKRGKADYFSQLEKRGFKIIEITEPKPSAEAVQKYPEYLSKFKNRPGFLFFKAIKM